LSVNIVAIMFVLFALLPVVCVKVIGDLWLLERFGGFK